jgi:hypothetical protein
MPQGKPAQRFCSFIVPRAVPIRTTMWCSGQKTTRTNATKVRYDIFTVLPLAALCLHASRHL